MRERAIQPAAALLLAAACAAPVAAQSELPGIFSEIIDVRVVNIEVVVVGRDGQRVGGLGPQDFRLIVDGQEVPIEYFTEVRGGQAVKPSPDAPEGAPAGLPQLPPGEAVGTSYLVFIDDFFAIARDRNKVLERLREQVPLLGPGDRMAVVAFDGKRLEMLSTWSQSVAGLERTFLEAQRREARGLERVVERKTLLSTRGLLADFNDPETLLREIGYRLTPEERAYAGLVEGQVKSVVQAASATLRSFAAPPGRKVLILLSGGWPFDPTQAASAVPNQPALDTEFDRGYELYKPLVDAANLLGYTIYPVDVPGLQGGGVDAAEFQAAPLITVEAPAGPELAQLAEQEAQSSLLYLASRTGGRALLNALRVEPLAKVAEDTRSYYWLGFTPARARDDRPHRIQVEVTRPGLKVRSRKGFLDFSRQTEVTAMVESALLFGNAPPSGALPVELGEVKRRGRFRMEVPLTIGIPVDQITVLPAGGQYVSEVELRVAALDEDGNQADIPVIPLRLAADQEPRRGGYARHDTTLKLRRKKHELLVAIYDPASGRFLSNRLEVAPQE